MMMLGCLAASAQRSSDFVLGKTDRISSVQLKEDRVLNIYLPENYHQDSATVFPVIYLLDGAANEDFIHITGVVQFLTMIQAMPPSIVVGIANVDRKRDFTFPTRNKTDREKYPSTGHSAAFIDFLERELQPYVQSHYRVGRRTIIGQSLGGLLATEVLLKRPALFDDYVIVSPSLWWDDESLLAAAPELLKKAATLPLKIYLAIGEEGAQMKDDAAKLAQLIGAAPDKQYTLHYVPYPAENHLTILHHAVYGALTVLYKK